MALTMAASVVMLVVSVVNLLSCRSGLLVRTYFVWQVSMGTTALPFGLPGALVLRI